MYLFYVMKYCEDTSEASLGCGVSINQTWYTIKSLDSRVCWNSRTSASPSKKKEKKKAAFFFVHENLL